MENLQRRIETAEKAWIVEHGPAPEGKGWSRKMGEADEFELVNLPGFLLPKNGARVQCPDCRPGRHETCEYAYECEMGERCCCGLLRESTNGCIGLAEHSWSLAIEEGQVSVVTNRCSEGCSFGSCAEADQPMVGLGEVADFLCMAPIPVRIVMATDCPAYDTDDGGVPTGPVKRMGGYESGSHYIAHGAHCDCNWWPVARGTGSGDSYT